MSLDKLIGKTLEVIEPDKEQIKRLLEAAERNIQDAHVHVVSDENRFDAAYKAILQLANAALQANGYRTLTSQPGHHMTMLQSLTKTILLSRENVIVLDMLRKQRISTDYSGDIVPESTMDECIAQAESLYHDVTDWIKVNKPEVLED